MTAPSTDSSLVARPHNNAFATPAMARTKQQSLTTATDAELQSSVSREVRCIGGLHRKIQAKARSMVELVKQIGDRLLALKSLDGVDWGAAKKFMQSEYGLGNRSLQVYMRVASSWEQIEQSGEPLESTSLRGLQRLVSSSSKAASAAPVKILPFAVAEAVIDFFGGAADFLYTVGDGTPPELPTAFKTGLSDPTLSEGGRLSGRVLALPMTTSHVEALVSFVSEAMATGQVVEAVLLLPAQITVKWASQIDARPRAYVRTVKPGKTMLVGFIERKRLTRFGAAFCTLGPVHFPYELLRQQ